MFSGECLCGKVCYEVDGVINDVSHCHCKMCQRIHGAAFGTYGAVQRRDFKWLSGKDMVKTYRSSDTMTRTFCGHCGSTLQAILDVEPHQFYLALGSANADPGCRPGYHIFVDSKAPWFEINDNLPQHATWSDDSQG